MPLTTERIEQQRDVLLTLKAISASLCRDNEGMLNAVEVGEKFTEVMTDPPASFTDQDVHFWLSYYGINFPKPGVYKSYRNEYHVILGIGSSDPPHDYYVIHGVLQEDPKILVTSLHDFTSIANNREPMYVFVPNSRQNQPYMVHRQHYEPIMRNLASSLSWSDAALSKGIPI